MWKEVVLEHPPNVTYLHSSSHEGTLTLRMHSILRELPELGHISYRLWTVVVTPDGQYQSYLSKPPPPFVDETVPL